jgi:hypothetical protein
MQIAETFDWCGCPGWPASLPESVLSEKLVMTDDDGPQGIYHETLMYKT